MQRLQLRQRLPAVDQIKPKRLLSGIVEANLNQRQSILQHLDKHRQCRFKLCMTTRFGPEGEQLTFIHRETRKYLYLIYERQI